MALPKLKVKRILSAKQVSNVTIIEVPKEVRGQQGEQGDRGSQGLTGPQGGIGLAPEHEVGNGRFRFKNPDGSWGKWINLPSPGTPPLVVKYTPITSGTEYYISESELTIGTNIFGISAPNVFTLWVPKDCNPRKIITVKEENSLADITVKVAT